MKFICFDGETKNNKYNLLGNNSKYVLNDNGLSSKECFNFLITEMAKHDKGYKFIIFRMSFDVNFWIKDFPEDLIVDFVHSKKIVWNNLELQYFENKFLKITKNKKTYYLYDIYNFFNKSFLKVIELLEIKLTLKEQSILDLGKENRKFNFSEMTLKQVIEYNKTECIIASKIADKIYYLMENSLYKDRFNKDKTFIVKNFFGASAISQKILKDFNFEKYSIEYDFYPNNIRKILESAYFGGRMEALKIGKVKNCFKYDINSAYPDIIKDLREICNIELLNYKNEDIEDQNLYYLNYKIIAPQNLIGLLPHRHSSGLLFFPLEGKGWFYGKEIKQFLRYAEKYFIDYSFGAQYIKVLLGDKIFKNTIQDIYEIRKELKKENDLRHYIYKITLNAIYGKLAQRVGSAKFYNSYFAGFITSSVRAKLLEASFNNWEDIIFFATDGILTNKELKVKVGEKIGYWEKINIKEGVILLSGIYQLIDNNNKIYSGERGYNFDFNEMFKDIQIKGFSEIKTQQFIGWKYGLKNHLAFKDKILSFIPVTKNINPIEANIKRLFFLPKNYNFNSLVNSDLVDAKKLNKSEKILFENNLEIGEL